MNSATWKDEDRQLFLTSELMEHFGAITQMMGNSQTQKPHPYWQRPKNLMAAPAVVLTAEYDILRDEVRLMPKKWKKQVSKFPTKNLSARFMVLGLAEALP